MKIYYNGLLYLELPDTKKVKGEFGNRLNGVQIYDVNHKIEVGAIYLPMISIETIGGMTMIQFANKERPIALLVLTRKRPYIHVEWIQKEDTIIVTSKDD